MTVTKTPAKTKTAYESICRLLESDGLVLLHKKAVPVNAVNLFDVLVAQGRRVTIEVDDLFIEEIRDLAGDSHS